VSFISNADNTNVLLSICNPLTCNLLEKPKNLVCQLYSAIYVQGKHLYVHVLR